MGLQTPTIGLMTIPYKAGPGSSYNWSEITHLNRRIYMGFTGVKNPT